MCDDWKPRRSRLLELKPCHPPKASPIHNHQLDFLDEQLNNGALQKQSVKSYVLTNKEAAVYIELLHAKIYRNCEPEANSTSVLLRCSTERAIARAIGRSSSYASAFDIEWHEETRRGRRQRCRESEARSEASKTDAG